MRKQLQAEEHPPNGSLLNTPLWLSNILSVPPIQAQVPLRRYSLRPRVVRDWAGDKAGQRRHLEKGKRSELDTWWFLLPGTHSSPLLVKSPPPQPPGTNSQSMWVCAPGPADQCIPSSWPQWLLEAGYLQSGPVRARSRGSVREGELFLPITGAAASHCEGLRMKPTQRKAKSRAEERQVPDDAFVSAGIQHKGSSRLGLISYMSQ